MNILPFFLTKKCLSAPIFVAGPGRSGTTILMEAIGTHKKVITLSGEAPLISQIGKLVYLHEFAGNKHYYNDSLKISKKYLYQCLRRICIESVGGKYYALPAIIRSQGKYLLRYNINNISINKSFWCTKMIPKSKEAMGLTKLFPKVKFLCILRNGIDVVQSRISFFGFSKLDFGTQCRTWVNSIKNLNYMNHLDSALVVRYEHLVNQPRRFFQEICSFIGLPYDNRMVDFIKKNMIHPLNENTKVGINVKAILDARKPSYKNWNSKQLEIFKKICCPTMKKLGYMLPF